MCSNSQDSKRKEALHKFFFFSLISEGYAASTISVGQLCTVPISCPTQNFGVLISTKPDKKEELFGTIL